MTARRRVVYSSKAREDLFEIYDYIAGKAGATVARQYVGRIQARCEDLDLFAERGVNRDDVRPGLRTMGYRRKATIAFVVEPKRVVVLAVYHHGRNVETRLKNL